MDAPRYRIDERSAGLVGLSKLRVLRLAALTALIVGVGTGCFIEKAVRLDPDMWWHLSVGDWIVQNHSFPHNGIFSGTAANRPWMAYSWGYEVLLSRSYDWFSFVGMGLFGTGLTIAVAMADVRDVVSDLRALLGSVGALRHRVRRIPL